jgi:hypothetical protein
MHTILYSLYLYVIEGQGEVVKLLLEKGAKKLQSIITKSLHYIIYIFIIIILIGRILGELIFIYSGMLPPDVSSICYAKFVPGADIRQCD